MCNKGHFNSEFACIMSGDMYIEVNRVIMVYVDLWSRYKGDDLSYLGVFLIMLRGYCVMCLKKRYIHMLNALRQTSHIKDHDTNVYVVKTFKEGNYRHQLDN